MNKNCNRHRQHNKGWWWLHGILGALHWLLGTDVLPSIFMVQIIIPGNFLMLVNLQLDVAKRQVNDVPISTSANQRKPCIHSYKYKASYEWLSSAQPDTIMFREQGGKSLSHCQNTVLSTVCIWCYIQFIQHSQQMLLLSLIVVPNELFKVVVNLVLGFKPTGQNQLQNSQLEENKRNSSANPIV